jgi:hypothetical protein
MNQWKKQQWEIHQTCKELGQSTYTDEYVKRFMDGISMEPPNSIPLNIDRMDDDADCALSEIMNSNSGTTAL